MGQQQVTVQVPVIEMLMESCCRPEPGAPLVAALGGVHVVGDMPECSMALVVQCFVQATAIKQWALTPTAGHLLAQGCLPCPVDLPTFHCLARADGQYAKLYIISYVY